MTRLVYVVGVPGVGKTTAVNQAAGEVFGIAPKPFHVRICERANVLGPDRPAFGGTDGLSMSVQPKVLAWLEEERGLVLGEGDRLANLSFLEGARDRGVDVLLVEMHCDPEVSAARRAARAEEFGLTLQDDRWLQGRVTKLRNLIAGWSGRRVSIPCGGDPDDVARDLAGRLPG